MAQRMHPYLRRRRNFFVVAVLSTTLSNSHAERPVLPESLDVEQAVQIALRDNPDVLLARLAVDAARAAVQTAGATPNPQLTVGLAGFNPAVGIGSGNLRSKTVDSSVRIDQLIERGSKKSLRMQNAAALRAAAQYDAQETRRLLGVAVRQAFYDLLGAQWRTQITAQSAALAEATVAAARKRQKAGDMAPSDVSRLLVDALRSENDLTQARADALRARLVMLQLLGHADQAAAITATGEWAPSEQGLERDVDVLVAQRADVRAALARLEAARAASRVALAARTRDVSVGVQYDHYPSSVANTQGGGNTFGIAIQIPLFIGNQFDGEIRSALLAVDSAEETVAKTRGAARNEVLRLLADQRSSSERLLRFNEQLLPAAKKSADAAEFAFAHGAIAIMDVLDVRRTNRLVQLDALAAQVEQAKLAASFQTVPEPKELP